MQQIIVSGVGGQGVLFVTKVLADTAMQSGYSVMVSETHGMAQRGGNVISHLKVEKRTDGASVSSNRLVSPLVRPGHADVLLSLHPDAILAHAHFLKPGGETFCNAPDPSGKNTIDATRIASSLGSSISANLVLLGFAAAAGVLFCKPQDIEATLESYGGKRREIALRAFLAGKEASSGKTR